MVTLSWTRSLSRPAVCVGFLVVCLSLARVAGAAPARPQPDPRPAAAERTPLVKWQEWGPAAFQLAADNDRPILLSLSPRWDYWSRLMQMAAYASPTIAAQIEANFVPILVDPDRRPDIASRYTRGAYPTTAFLTPAGEPIVVTGYLSPDALQAAAQDVPEAYHKRREEVNLALSAARESRERWRQLDASAKLPDDLTTRVVAEAKRAYDEETGGFGWDQGGEIVFQPRFLQYGILSLLLVASRQGGDESAREMIGHTLDGALKLRDPVAGGFYHYAAQRDWTEPGYEKLLPATAETISAYLEGYQAFGKAASSGLPGPQAPGSPEEWKRAAIAGLEYVAATLTDKAGFFYASQAAGAQERYYGLKAEARAKVPAPAVDRTLLADWNGPMIRAELRAAAVLGEARYRERAVKALDAVLERCYRKGEGMFHLHTGDAPGVPGLLQDQAEMIWTLAAAYKATQKTSYLEAALDLAGFITEKLGDQKRGGFYDTVTDPSALGELRYRERPWNGNVAAAMAFLELASASGQPAFAEVARRALEAFGTQWEAYGAQAAAYAVAVERLHEVAAALPPAPASSSNGR